MKKKLKEALVLICDLNTEIDRLKHQLQVSTASKLNIEQFSSMTDVDVLDADGTRRHSVRIYRDGTFSTNSFKPKCWHIPGDMNDDPCKLHNGGKS
jgi:hypothetical protein